MEECLGINLEAQLGFVVNSTPLMIREISRGEGMHRSPVKCAPDKHFHFFLCRETNNIYFSNISTRQENERVCVCENMIILCYYITISAQQIQTTLTVFSSHSISRVLQGEYCCRGADGSGIGRY